jgi:hypothetical protein
MKNQIKIKLSDDLKIIETSVFDVNTGKLIENVKTDRMDKDRQARLKKVIESGYVQFESINTTT